MCGIVGYFDRQQGIAEGRALLARMAAALAHRGPDDEGFFSTPQVGLGVRRLSIVDVAGGHQPIGDEAGTRWVALNGEIYNFQQLRPALEAQGLAFRTRTDTEVVLRQHQAEGPAAVHRFNGMFAYAVWDGTVQTLWLVRDRLGVKPLYYHWDGRRLLFASELKGLLASGLVLRRVDEEALWDYLTFRYVPQPRSIWQGVRKLPPGCWLRLGPGDAEPVVERYWQLPCAAPASAVPRAEQERVFGALLEDAIRLRLMAEVPVGVLLSGGLDSSTVAAVAARQQRGLATFSVGFQGAPETDERPYARLVAEALGTDHHEVEVTPEGFLAFLPQMVHFADEPLADLTMVPLFYVTQHARKTVKVLLSGEGSDEVLGGYHFDRLMQRWTAVRWYQRLPRVLRERVAYPLARRMHPRWGERVAWANTPLPEWGRQRPLVMTDYLDTPAKAGWWRRAVAFEDSLAPVRRAVAELPTDDPLQQALHTFCQAWLADDLLAKADRMTMANSVELRTPFLDVRLVEWAAAAPSEAKVGRDGWGRFQTKRLLRAFARTRLPREILARPKQGFPIPVNEWLAGRWAGWAKDLCLAPAAQARRWFRDEALARAVAEGTQPGNRAGQGRLWNLLVLELWLRAWKPE